MEPGAVTSYFDVAQIMIWLFWFFFAGLIFYLRREDKREGYPLESDRSGGRIQVVGFPSVPDPKTFILHDGDTAQAPSGKVDTRPIRAVPVAPWPGAPLEPTGNPMVDGVGPAAYAERANTPDRTLEGHDKIVPLRIARDFALQSRDPDPRGMRVLGADGEVAGTVQDVWIDQAEFLVRYYEVEVPTEMGSKRVLLPANFADVAKGSNRVRVKSILARHFADVPALQNPDRVTLLEEDKITAYYASGYLYALPSRSEPII